MGKTGTRFLEEGERGGHLQERFYQYIKKFTQKDALRKKEKVKDNCQRTTKVQVSDKLSQYCS